MKNSQKILKDANILPKLRLGVKTDKGVQGTGPHTVRFLEDKEAKDKDPQTGKDRAIVSFLVEENGVKKSYRTPKFGKDGQISYLIQQLAEVEEGEEVVMEMKKAGIKNYISVMRLKPSTKNIDFDNIPIIDEDEQTTDNQDFPVEGQEQE